MTVPHLILLATYWPLPDWVLRVASWDHLARGTEAADPEVLDVPGLVGDRVQAEQAQHQARHGLLDHPAQNHVSSNYRLNRAFT